LTKIAVLLAMLGAALATGLAPDSGAATPANDETGWVERRLAEVVPGQAYRLDGCLTIAGQGVDLVVLRALWYETADGSGSSIYRDDAQANTALVGVEQCLTLAGLHSPCAARSLRYGVLVLGDAAAVSVSNLELSADPSVEPIACPTPTPPPQPDPTTTAAHPRLTPSRSRSRRWSTAASSSCERTARPTAGTRSAGSCCPARHGPRGVAPPPW
jgi:hypothetical protein